MTNATLGTYPAYTDADSTVSWTNVTLPASTGISDCDTIVFEFEAIGANPSTADLILDIGQPPSGICGEISCAYVKSNIITNLKPLPAPVVQTPKKYSSFIDADGS